MRLLLAAATVMEIEKLMEHLKGCGSPSSRGTYLICGLEIALCITGVGGLHTMYALWESHCSFKPDFSLMLGVAGAFEGKFTQGQLVFVESEVLGDLGAEDGGDFLDVFDLGLMEPDGSVFLGKELLNPLEKESLPWDLPFAKSITVNTTSGRRSTIERLGMKYDPDIESMEGAAFHFFCLMQKIPFLQVRSISNMVEPRDKSKWEMKKAIAQLNDWAIGSLENGAFHRLAINH